MMTSPNTDILTTRVTDGIALITLGSANRIYFDEEMGDALTEALDGFAGDANIRVVVITGGAPGYFIRHFTNHCAYPPCRVHARLRSRVARKRDLQWGILR
jgi:enoyl-CoA hydratase/carnithine racemase